MRTRRLGTQGLAVSEQGLGCMGMSEFYGTSNEREAIATIHRALALGITFRTASSGAPCQRRPLFGGPWIQTTSPRSWSAAYVPAPGTVIPDAQAIEFRAQLPDRELHL